MFLEPAIASLIIAKLRNGSFKRLVDVHIRGWYFLIISASLQIGMSIVKSQNYSFYKIYIEDYFFYLHFISYVLLVIAIVLNIFKLSMKFFLFGLLLNAIVIFSNAGKMPVNIDSIKEKSSVNIEIKASDIKHEAMTEDTRANYLADIIVIPPPYPFPKIISVGDIFLMIGVFIFFQETMVEEEKVYKQDK